MRDYLRFYIDGVSKGAWSGESAWAQQSFAVATGNHVFKWTYSKDSSGASGADAAWVNDIVFPDAAIVPPAVTGRFPSPGGTVWGSSVNVEA